MTSTPVPGPAALPVPDLAPRAPVPVPVTDAHRLDVYHVAVAAQAQLALFLPRCTPVLRDQLERASVSVVLNIAEGAGRFSRGEKRRHYSSAHCSAVESVAVLDLLTARGLIAAQDCQSARHTLVRVVQMLVKLERRMAR